MDIEKIEKALKEKIYFLQRKKLYHKINRIIAELHLINEQQPREILQVQELVESPISVRLWSFPKLKQIYYRFKKMFKKTER